MQVSIAGFLYFSMPTYLLCMRDADTTLISSALQLKHWTLILYIREALQLTEVQVSCPEKFMQMHRLHF